MAICRSCGEEVRWVRRPNGKRMPINVDPYEGREADETLYRLEEEDETVAYVASWNERQDPDAELYICHLAECFG